MEVEMDMDMPLRTAKSTESFDGIASPSKRQRRSASRRTSKAKGKGKQPVLPVEERRPHTTDSASDQVPKGQGTLYDAVAGRLSDNGFIIDGTRKPLAPDEFLFKRKNAPIRYEEDDKYFAHRRLPPDQKLPESDLLKTIHAYVSDFYGSGRLAGTHMDYQSMDETALLAMGILLEEACAHSLGETGDLAFVEWEKATPEDKT